VGNIMEQYDLAVIGGGPAGYTAADLASSEGLKTVLFEEAGLGGVCLNEGCVPTKVLLNSSKLLYSLKGGAAYGIQTGGGDLSISHESVLRRKEKVIRSLVAGVKAKLAGSGAAVIYGSAAISGQSDNKYIVTQLTGPDSGRRFEAARVLAAPGSAPIIPNIDGLSECLDSDFCVTSKETLSLSETPKNLVIVGGGVIGLELADYYNAAGSNVTVVELLDRIAYPMDGEIAKILLENLKKKGIAFRLATRFIKAAPGYVMTEPAAKPIGTGTKPAATGDMPADTAAKQTEAGDMQGCEKIPADKVLIAIGRKPRISGFGAEALGVQIERGAVLTDCYMRTNIPNIYAAGDINGKSMLAHTAYREAARAVRHMAGKPVKMDYGAIPSIVYTYPEAAGVGETEESASASGLSVKTITLPLRYSGRYVAESESGDGICKVLVNAKSGNLLGMHIIGSYASEIILSAAFMIESRWPAEALRELAFPHPTVGEAIREALYKI